MDYQAWTNHLWTKYEYDGRGLISSVLHRNTQSNRDLARRDYWRDDRDRILAWKRGSDNFHNGMEDGRGDRYGYDDEGQLTSASYRAENPENGATTPDRIDTFSYDKIGNRMGSNYVASRGTMNFTRKNNGLNQYSGWWPYSSTNYDDDVGGGWGAPGAANGILMQDGWITAGFNALNQPVAMWSRMYPGGASAQYLWFGYDPLGRCVKRWKGTEDQAPVGPNPTTYYYYDGWNLIQEGPSSGMASRVYVHGGRMDEIVTSQAGGVWSYHQYDAQGNCILLTDTNGGIREQYDYDAFGMPYVYNAAGDKLSGPAQWGNRFLFTGREWLKDLKVYDYRNRMYQPELGRFLQPDPKQFEAGDYNLYRYCHNDPVNLSDPMGLSVDRTWDRQMYLQGGEKRSFEVVEKIKDLHSNGWVTVGHALFKERNQTDSAPGKPTRNLGGSELDKLGGEMAKMASNTGPRGQEQISWLFEKNGTPGAYAASMPIPGGAEPKQFKEEGNQPRLGVSATPTFVPKGYHYVGFAYSHLLPDRVIPLIDRQRAWRNRLDAYLAVPHQGSSFPDVLRPYHYDPNVFPTN